MEHSVQNFRPFTVPIRSASGTSNRYGKCPMCEICHACSKPATWKGSWMLPLYLYINKKSDDDDNDDDDDVSEALLMCIYNIFSWKKQVKYLFGDPS